MKSLKNTNLVPEMSFFDDKETCGSPTSCVAVGDQI